MDAVVTLSDQAIDIFNSNFARVGQFQRTSRHESTGGDTEDDGFKERLVSLIERTVDEYASAGGRWHLGLTMSNN